MSACRSICLLAVLPSLLIAVSSGQASNQLNQSRHEYFVDCSSATNGSGESSASPWNSLDALESKTFSAGDIIRLRRGTECHGSLEPKGSGSADHTIRLTAYGDGPRPKIIAGDKPAQAFKLFNQEYWDVDSLDFSGGSTFGVFVSGNKGILHHIHLANLLVHDVLGQDIKHKESGLVVISPGTVNQRFDDVLVDGVTAYNTRQWVGIVVGGGNFGFPPEDTWSTNVIIRNSIVHDVQGDGIVLFRVRNGLIDSSVAWRTGMQVTQTIGTPNAIWTWMCHDCIVSNSEAFLTDSPGVDGGAFDIDYGNTNNSVIDSFGHDTLGYCVAVFGAGFVTRNSVVRGNACIDNGRSPRLAAYQGAIFLHTWNNGVIDGLSMENNTVYWNPLDADPPLINDATIRGEAVFKHNTIYSTSPFMLSSNRALSLDANHYFYYGTQPQYWRFDGVDLDGFKSYQQKSRQDLDSSVREVGTTNASPLWFGPGSSVSDAAGRSLPSSQGGSNLERKAPAFKNVPGQWRIHCRLPGTLTSDGLLDPAASRQLTILKSISLQFPVASLKIVVSLRGGSKTESATHALRAAIRDLQMNSVTFLPDHDTTTASNDTARLTLSSPDGKIRAAWNGFAGPTQIGVAVRKALGTPLYPQMETSKNE